MNTSRKSRYVLYAELAYRLAQQALPTYSHAKSPHRFTWPQLTACVLLLFYLDLSYRDMEEWLLASDQVCQALALSLVPDHATLCRAFHRLKRRQIDRLYRAFLSSVEGQEEVIVHDTTGFAPTQASLHYLARSGRSYQHFIKAGYAVGLSSHYILAAASRLGPGADSVELPRLRREATRYGQHRRGRIAYFTLADAGFDGQQVHAGDVIPPRRPQKHWPQGERLVRFELVSQARLEGLYGHRWVCETVNSVIKRKMGQGVRSRKAYLRFREPVLKGLAYNLHVL